MNFMCVHLFNTSAKYIYWSYSNHGSTTCYICHFSCSDGHIYTHACSNYHILNCISALWATRYKYISSHALLYCLISISYFIVPVKYCSGPVKCCSGPVKCCSGPVKCCSGPVKYCSGPVKCCSGLVKCCSGPCVP